jgi:hypothetical protein
MWRRPGPALSVASVALFFSLTGTGFAVGRLTEASGDRQVTPAQLAEQREIERIFHSEWQTTIKQCSAKNVPDAQCNNFDRLAPIGSSTVSCGSGGCFEGDGTDAPVDEVTPGESCTTADDRAGVWEAIDNPPTTYACEIYGSTP